MKIALEEIVPNEWPIIQKDTKVIIGYKNLRKSPKPITLNAEIELTKGFGCLAHFPKRKCIFQKRFNKKCRSKKKLEGSFYGDLLVLTDEGEKYLKMLEEKS